MIFGIIIFQIAALIAFVYTFSKYSMNHSKVKKLGMKKAEEYQIKPFNKDEYFDAITKLSVELGEDFEKFKEENKVYTLWWGAEGIQLKKNKINIVKRFSDIPIVKESKNFVWEEDIYDWSKKKISRAAKEQYERHKSDKKIKSDNLYLVKNLNYESYKKDSFEKPKESKLIKNLYLETESKTNTVYGGKGNQILTIWNDNSISFEVNPIKALTNSYKLSNSKKEIIKLIDMLDTYKISYKILNHPPFDWTTVIIYKNGKELLRATQSDFTYGGKENLIEIMGDFVNRNALDENVIGWLKAEDIFERYLNSALNLHIDAYLGRTDYLD